MELGVEKIMWRKYNAEEKKMYFRIKWEGFSWCENSTEPEENCTNCSEMKVILL